MVNRRKQIGENETRFTNFDFNSQGDLIIESFIYIKEPGTTGERYFYGIKSNGREFIHHENSSNKITIESTPVYKFESQLVTLNLVNDEEEKDFYLSTCFSYFAIDSIDLYNNKIITINQSYLFDFEQWTSKYFNVLTLANEPKTYLFCFIGNITTNETKNFYLSLQKFQFYNTNISDENSYKRIASSPINDTLRVNDSMVLTCIEIVKYKLIQCFYKDIDAYLTIGLFNEKTLDLLYSKVVVNNKTKRWYKNDNLTFHQCIHLKDEVSILGYIIDNKDYNHIYLQIKNIIYNSNTLEYDIENYLNFNNITLNNEKKNSFYIYYYAAQLKKINDNRFAIIIPDNNRIILYFILIDIYDYSSEVNLFIRYYSVPFKFYNFTFYFFVKSLTFNGFLGIVYTVNYNSNKPYRLIYQYFSIISYINGIDSPLIYLKNDEIIKIKDYINEAYIENNVFGVELYGIKIIKLPKSNETGVFFFSKNNNKIINDNEILSPDDEIIFIYDYVDLKKGDEVYTIEMAGVVQEPEFSKALEYTIYNESFGSIPFDKYYKQNIFVGKTIFYNFSISNNLNGENNSTCTENCKVCYNNICLKCLNYYNLNNETNICELTIPKEGYYYNESLKIYEKCYPSCKSCSKGPIYNNELKTGNMFCDECAQDYYELESTKNCYTKDNPPLHYFFNDLKNDFSKCYDNCQTCSQYKKNSTYFNCLSCDSNNIFFPKSSNCLNCANINKFVNFYQYKCIDFIPDGYYLSNETTNEIDSCYITCKS